MNDDPKRILDGVKDLIFTLRRKTPPGPNAEYDFIHDAVDPENDPFKDTSFKASGSGLLSPPMLKLDPWKKSERTRYDDHVRTFLKSKPDNMMKLTGKKMFEGKPETLTLYLLPEAISRFGGGTSYTDLIVMTCEIDGPHIQQDGTAHGNPR